VGTNRLEAFSDGVIAILITIMVLDLKAPDGSSFIALRALLPMVLTYVLSFVYLGIYWNNHHHMLHATECVTGGILWANLYLLFWLSLIPVTTAWLDETQAAPAPVATYGLVLLMAAIAYWILQQRIIASQGPGSLLRVAVSADWKGKSSPFLYAIAIGLALRWPTIALTIYALVALIWLIPDRRIERVLVGSAKEGDRET
jgi:TMEM175 potassium channel family protein